MRKDKKIDGEMTTYDGKDFLEDVKELLNLENIPDEVISPVIGYFQQQEDFARLAAMKDEPGAYRNFLSKVVVNLPISYASHKIEETLKGLKSNFKLSEGDAQLILAKAFEMIKSQSVAVILDQYADIVVNEKTVPDSKMPPFKVVDPNERGLKIVKDETIIH